MSKKRRGSRLFSGQPGLLLVSEDIPGIIMPAPPAIKDLPPLEEDDETFDIDALHAEEDAAESAGHEGPLRVFLGAPSGDAPAESAVPMDAETAEAAEDGPIWDVSALAMPEAPDEDETPAAEGLDFLDDSADISDDEVVSLDGTPPPLVMQVTLGEDPGLSAGEWSDESPTVPAAPVESLVSDEPPPVHVSAKGDPLDVPDRTPFAPEDEGGFSDEAPTRVEALVNQALDDGGLQESEWNEDEETFFGDSDLSQRNVPDTPPSFRVPPQNAGGGFRPIPEKVDPPIGPILAALVGISVIAVVAVWKFTGETPAPTGTLENPRKAAQPITVHPAKVRQPSEVNSTVKEPIGDVGYLNIESNKDAIIYVDDQKVGTTPLKKVKVATGNHRVLAMGVETGERKSATTLVVRGEDRLVRFEFR